MTRCHASAGGSQQQSAEPGRVEHEGHRQGPPDSGPRQVPRDARRGARLPYHDSISVCTAPSHSKTTAAFDPNREVDVYVIDGETVTGRGAERIDAVVDHVRDLAGIDHGVRFESRTTPDEHRLWPSSSGFAAAAMALVEAAGLDLTRPEISTVARRGSSSAARAVTGAFSHLWTGMNDTDCRSERIETDLEDDLRIVAAHVPAYKETEQAHAEAADSHMFQARMAHIHAQIDDMRDALYDGDFDAAFELAEHDSLSLAATTMTGPAGWVYWQPRTIAVFNAVRRLRNRRTCRSTSPTDTGASVYINTTEEHVDRVEETSPTAASTPASGMLAAPHRFSTRTGAVRTRRRPPEADLDFGSSEPALRHRDRPIRLADVQRSQRPSPFVCRSGDSRPDMSDSRSSAGSPGPLSAIRARRGHLRPPVRLPRRPEACRRHVFHCVVEALSNAYGGVRDRRRGPRPASLVGVRWSWLGLQAAGPVTAQYTRVEGCLFCLVAVL